MFPVVTVSGPAHARGLHYGQQAASRIRHSLSSYAELYREEADLDWAQSVAEARRYLSAIDDFAPQYLEEMAGMAAGAGVEPDDVLALNLRTEILFAARVRAAGSQPPPSECTVFAAVARNGHVVAGQNWDWMPFALDTVVVLRSEPDDGPGYLTLVEAGLLAKFGVNSAGLAVLTNALACSEDQGDVGVPYHVMLRAMLDAADTDAALALLSKAERASSANYLLVDKTGRAVNVEGRPGGSAEMHQLIPDESGFIAHTNHFIAADFPATDYATMVESTSRTRLGQIATTAAAPNTAHDLAGFIGPLTDHTNAPDSVCRHVDTEVPFNDQSVTVASMLVDLTEPEVLVSEGPPCLKGYETLTPA